MLKFYVFICIPPFYLSDFFVCLFAIGWNRTEATLGQLGHTISQLAPCGALAQEEYQWFMLIV